MELLDGMGIGDPLRRDCQVTGMDSSYSTLTLDELMQEDPMEQQEEPEIGPVMM